MTEDNVPSPTNSYPQFKHREQLDAGKIRLLSRGQHDRNHDQSSNSVNHSLIAVPIDAAPNYVALSYTWGAPLETSESHAAYDGKTRELLLVDGQGNVEGMQVQLNLWEAIQALEATPTEAKYYWIDAICINQEDLDERASQVTRMASIYSSAHIVAVWLGRGFSRKAEALELWREAGPRITIYNRELQGYTPTDRANIISSEWNSRVFKQRLGYDLTPLLETFQLFVAQHRWFRRTWVVQEVVVAGVADLRPPLVLWEEHQLSWKDIAATCGLLSRIYRSAVDGTPDDGIRRSASLFERRQRLGRYYRQVIRSLTEGKPLMWPSLRMFRTTGKSSLIAAFFANLLKTVRLLHTTESRDRVYFGFGLVEELHRRWGGGTSSLPPVDYRLSVATVYQQTMAYLVKEIPSLLVLGYRSPSDVDTASASCPSWVPRFDLDHQFHSGPVTARAGLSKQIGSFLRRVDGDVLTLTGKRLGQLNRLSEVSFSLPETSRDLVDLGLVESILKFMFSSTDMQIPSSMTHVKATAISMLCGSVTNSDIKSEEQPWRSGLCEMSFSSNPGPWYINQLMDFATVTLARILNRNTTSTMSEDDMRVGVCHMMAEKIEAQCRRSEASEDVQWISESRTRWLMQTVGQVHDSSMAPTEDVRGGYRMVVVENAKTWHNAALAIDRMFRGRQEDPTALLATDTGYVGRSRMHARVGDELWLIGDCPFPVILRRADANNESDGDLSYQLISPAWVNGVMEGELMTETTISEMEPVRLV